MSASPFRCPISVCSRALAGTPARPVGRGRSAGACPWLEVDEGGSEEGARLVRPGAACPGPPRIGRDCRAVIPRRGDRQRDALRCPEGLHPDSGWRDRRRARRSGAAAEPGAAPLEALERARWAGRAQESSVPASRRRWRTSSLSAPATPPPPLSPPPLRAGGSAYSEIPCLCQRAKWLLLSLPSLPSLELERPGVRLSGLGRLVVLPRRVGLASSPRGGRR